MRKQMIIVAVAGGALTLIILNILIWHSAWIGIAGGLWLVGISLLAGSLFIKGDAWERMSLGLLVTVCLIILLSSASFYLWNYTNLHVALITIFIPIVLLWIELHGRESLVLEWLKHEITKSRNHEIKLRQRQFSTWLRSNLVLASLLIVYITLYAFAVITILSNQTDQAIRSPWEAVPRTTLLVYFLATVILFTLINRVQKSSPFLLSAHFFLSFSLALLVYKIGYGFDPFVHRAAETLLSNTGAIEPKPYLYVGQYTLVVFLSKLLSIPLTLVDKWLLPVLASLLLPTLITLSLRKNFLVRAISDRSYHYFITTLSLLILPSPFIATIPQPLANLLYLLLIFLSLLYLAGSQIPLSLLWGIGAAIFFIHALTGFPALIYLTLLTLFSRPPSHYRTATIAAVTLLGAFIIPALLVLNNILNGVITQTAQASLPFPAFLPRYLPFLSLPHTAELWHSALPLVFIIAAIAGTAYLWKQKKKNMTAVPWLTTLSLALSFLLLRHINLGAIIAYERAEFTERILELIGMTLLPFFAFTLIPFTQVLSCTRMGWGRFLNLTCLATMASLITIGFYYSYPRVDAFAKSRGYSVSRDDLAAVRWIEDDARGEPYIVLANQSVSAAALQELGFKQYFPSKNCQLITNNCQLFFYPIPTSSPLYQLYLDMVYKEPSRETIEKAMDLAGVRRAYFVLNDYWLDSAKIKIRAAQEANATRIIQSVYAFTYLQ